MANGNSDVTVVVPCFNHGRFLGESISSALGQQGGPPHVIVVDDGSTDPATAAAIDILPDGVESFRQQNAGPAAARNAGIERSDTPYVLMLDADDRMPADCIASLREPLDADPKLGYSYGVMRFFGDWSGEIRFPPFDPYRLLYRAIVGWIGLVRRETWQAAGGFDPRLEGYEDWDFTLGALEKGWRGHGIDKVVLDYRRHARSGLVEHRSIHRRIVRQLRNKHASLYARADEFAKQTDLNAAGRLFYRSYWAWRPIPWRLERTIYSMIFRG